MSVVVGKVFDNRIELVADAAISTENFSRTIPGIKTYSEENLVIGACGFPESLPLLRMYAATQEGGFEPLKQATFDVPVAMAFFEGFYQFLAERNIIQSNFESVPQFAFLLGNPHRLLSIEGYFINEVDNFYTIGAGSETATAALYLGETPENAVKLACSLSPWCSEPVEIYTLIRQDGEVHHDNEAD